MDLDEIRFHLTGPLASVKLPFTKDSEVDYDGLRNFIDASIIGGSRSIILTAGDSHFQCLSDNEISEVTRITCEHTKNRAMVVAAEQNNGTNQAIAFAQYIKKMGANILMCMPPTWGGITPDSLAEHFSEVAKVLPVMIVTNIFQNVSPSVGLETVKLTLEKSDNVLAVKDDIGGPFVRRMCIDFHDRLAIFSGGQKQNHLKLLPFGCDGYMSLFVTFNSTLSKRYWNAVEKNDIKTLRTIVSEYDAPIFEFLFNFSGGINKAVHGLHEIYNIAGRWRRKPYTSLTTSELDRLSEFLYKKDLLPPT